jgi:hypothetical protein
MPREDCTGITRTDLQEMRRIFDDAAIARPRHCFRWSVTEERWEISEVAPADRTLLAYQTDDGWTDV